MNKKLRIIFFGTPHFVIPVMEALEHNFYLVGTVTAPDQKVGRKQVLTPSPVKTATKSVMLNSFQHLNKIPKQVRDDIIILTPEKLDAVFCDKLQALSPDLIVVSAYGKIIPQNVLEIPKFGAINIHPSLLPKYRGASPIQSAILAGEKVSGISIIKMDEKMDHGPIIYAEEFSVTDLDNFQTLSTKMFSRSALFLPKIIPAFVAGEIKLQEQNEDNATFCKMIKKEDGYFDISDPDSFKDITQFSPTTNYELRTTKLDKMIRAYYSWPTAWTRWSPSSHPEGLNIDPKDLKIVKFLPNGLVQMEGKKPVRLEEFLRGYPNFPIKKLN